MSLEITYKKHSCKIFKDLEDAIQVKKLQCYVPLYNRFFNLDDKNWNAIQLNQPWELTSVQVVDPPIYEGSVSGKSKKKVDVFFKLSPLLDPLKYLAGEYDKYDYSLPTLTPHEISKLSETNNSAYVDGFFSYLTSRLLEKGFLHGIDFYGSYLGIKENFIYNIDEDIEYLQGNDYFNSNRNVLFTCDFIDSSNDSRKFKERLIINENIILDDVETLDDNSKPSSTISKNVLESEIEIDDLSKDKINSDDDDTIETDYDDIEVTIKQFPVQVIALEACESTLDELMEDDMPSAELQSALMQVIMILIVYENVFDFTHNDLHTNNIMYTSTTKKFLFYQYKGIQYKVPTFGRIYKLIDFGRAIYRINGQRFVSDSFQKEGDASTQYNMEPFMDPTLPVVEPNYSFDLCRLGCSMYELIEEGHPLKSLVEEWCKDDEGVSVLYTETGEERYPNFKLYTMISRTVSRHTPEKQLDRPEFQVYRTTNAKQYMDLDALPCYK